MKHDEFGYVSEVIRKNLTDIGKRDGKPTG